MIFRAKNHEIDLTSRALVMGILNVTVDSFSDGGKFLAPESAVAHALQMADEGAAIIDVGGESTRPGADPVTEEEELARVLPVIGALAGAFHSGQGGAARKLQPSAFSLQPFPLISIDTSKAAVARAALAHGASIINDVTGLRGDPAMLEVARATGAGVIIMHMQGTPRTMQATPQYDDVVSGVRDFFRQSFTRAVTCGIDPMSIAFDPGIGFGKSTAHNLSLLKHLAELRVEGRPLVLGVSRKSFIGKLLGTDSIESRDAATATLTALLRERGADILRVHEVKRNVESLRLAGAIQEAL
jgi:dihydropteroate synthase